MKLDERTQRNLQGVHPALGKVLVHAPVLPGFRLVVTEGVRTIKRQQKLLKAGKSKTLNSRHLTGHAFDFALFPEGGTEPTWDFSLYRDQWEFIRDTADELEIGLTWGGYWPSIKDGTHIQLSWEAYPLTDRPKRIGTSKTIAAATAGLPIAALVPEITKAIESFSEALSGFSEEWGRSLQLVMIMSISAFIIWERVKKIRQEGV